MKIFHAATADWHVGHEKCLKFDNRPFRNMNDMCNALVKRYNAVVPTYGRCFFLGDMGWGNESLLRSVITKLNGTKILVLGNHDRGSNAMYSAGFDVVLNSATVYIANERVTMSHCPLRGVFREDVTGMKGAVDGENWHKERKHDRFSIEDEGQYHMHGHIHSPNGGRSQRILDKQIDVGVTANKYMPVSFSQIESWITRHKMGYRDGI